MNKFILCAMDKSKTVEELRENRDAAYDAWSAAAYTAAYDADADAAYTAADDAYTAADADAAAAYTAYWIDKYFKQTGENREDYENKIQEINR